VGFDARFIGRQSRGLRAIERGEINPTLRVLCKVGYGLRVPASDLLVMAERLAAERRQAQIGHEEV
jgi:transcriptional regulator with XRE-family HTH domain